jgi:hypothetical protein
MKLHSIGDSHARCAWETIPISDDLPFSSISTNELGSFTMARFGLEKLNLVNIKDERFHVEEGDIVCFCFGEVDSRSHLSKEGNFPNYRELIDEITPRYFDAIKTNIEQFQRIIPLVYNVPPPVKKEDLSWINPDLPHEGTNEERKEIVLYINNKLKEYCEKYDYIFVDVYEKYTDIDGFLNPHLAWTVHIGDPIYLIEFLKTKF